MASLIAQDTSGVFVAGPQEVEVPKERTRSFRKFRLPDAPDGRRRWRIGGGVGPVHYRSDGDPWGNALYDEIDLALKPNILSGEDRWRMDRAGFQVRLYPSFNGLPYAAEYRRAGAVIRMAPVALLWENDAGEQQVIRKPIAGLKESAAEGYGIWWPGAFGAGIDFGYDLRPDQFRKVVRINKPTDLPTPTIGTKGLRLTVAMTLSWEGAAPQQFADRIVPATIADLADLKALPTERLMDPGKLAVVRPDEKHACWFHEPVAWDSAEERREWPVTWRLERRGATVLALFGVTATALNHLSTVYPVYVDTAIAEEQVGASADDARNLGGTWPGDGSFASNTTTHRIDMAVTPNYYIFGARFQTVPIPKDPTINTSSISVMADADTTLNCNVLAGFELTADDDADTFATGTHEPYDAQQAATTGVAWNIGTGAWTAGNFYPSSDLSVDCQTLVNRTNWATGQDLIIVIWNPNVAAANNYRTIRTYDYNTDPVFTGMGGPKFNCTYTEAATGHPALRRLGLFDTGFGFDRSQQVRWG